MSTSLYLLLDVGGNDEFGDVEWANWQRLADAVATGNNDHADHLSEPRRTLVVGLILDCTCYATNFS